MTRTITLNPVRGALRRIVVEWIDSFGQPWTAIFLDEASLVDFDRTLRIRDAGFITRIDRQVWEDGY